MKKYLAFIISSAVVLTVAGCSCPTSPSCNQPASKKSRSLADYWAFYEAKDPCADGRACTIEEKRAYARLGQKAALNTGIVPIDPKYGRPALECPIEYIRGKDYQCPEGTCSPTLKGCGSYETGKGEETCSVTPQQPQHSQTGYLLTAFDTEAGTKFIILKADEKFAPETTLEDVAGTYESVAKTISEGEGNIAIYLTAFPLVETEYKINSRIPNDFDVEHIRVIAERLGKKGQLRFRKWN